MFNDENTVDFTPLFNSIVKKDTNEIAAFFFNEQDSLKPETLLETIKALPENQHFDIIHGLCKRTFNYPDVTLDAHLDKPFMDIFRNAYLALPENRRTDENYKFIKNTSEKRFAMRRAHQTLKINSANLAWKKHERSLLRDSATEKTNGMSRETFFKQLETLNLVG